MRIFKLENMLKKGRECLRYRQRHYIPPALRFLALLLFVITAIRLTFQGKITFFVLLKILSAAPAPLLLNGSISSLEFLAVSVEYADFARSEMARLSKSPAAQLT